MDDEFPVIAHAPLGALYRIGARPENGAVNFFIETTAKVAGAKSVWDIDATTASVLLALADRDDKAKNRK